MTMETVSAVRTDKRQIMRTAASVTSALLAVLSVWLLAGLSMNRPRYELNEMLVITGVAALVGFLGLVALRAHWGWCLAILIATAIPGILALAFFLFTTLIAWTAGVHTFASSWRPISFGFSVTAAFFLPPVVAGVLLIIRKRPTSPKVAVVVVGIGVLYALCVYRGFFG